MTSGAITAGSVLPTEAKVCCTNIAPKAINIGAINIGDNLNSARRTAAGKAEVKKPPPENPRQHDHEDAATGLAPEPSPRQHVFQRALLFGETRDEAQHRT